MRDAIELTPLRYFRAVARGGSLTAAARELRVSQPTLSVALRRLEQTLGTCLLYRKRDGIQLTDAGRELLNHADDIIASVDKAAQAVRGVETGDAGRFVLSCPDVLGAYFLPPLLLRLAREMPQFEISLRTGKSREVERAVIEREAHFGLVSRATSHPDLVRVELFADVIQLFALGPLPSRQEALKERVRQGPLLFVERMLQVVPDFFQQLDDQGALSPRHLSCGTYELVKSLALAGIGVAVMPWWVATYDGQGPLQPLGRPWPRVKDPIYLIFRADLHRTRASLRLKDELIARGEALRGMGPDLA